MSWDVFVQKLPAEARRVADIPDDYQPSPLGDRSSLIEKIVARFPDVSFSDPAWGKLHRSNYAIDIGMGTEESVAGMTLHVRGSDEAVQAVVELIEAVDGRGVDSWTGELFDPSVGLHSIRRWRAYVDEA